MKPPPGFLRVLGVLAAIVIIGFSGFYAGTLFSRQGTPNHSRAETISKAVQSIPPAPRVVYDASPPSRGAYIETIAVPIAPQGDSAIVTLPAAQSERIEAGQDVVLYRADGMLLQILGSVQAVEQDGDSATITLALNEDAAHPAAEAARGEIVIYKSKEAQRLPHAAIDKSTNPPSLWEVVRDEFDQTNVVRRNANIIGQTYDFVVVEQPDYISNVYILNPDSNLSDGAAVQTQALLYAAPPDTPDIAVARAIDERTPRVIGDPYRGPPIIVPCELEMARAGAPGTQSAAPANPSGQGCGSQRDALQQFIDSIRAAPAAP